MSVGLSSLLSGTVALFLLADSVCLADRPIVRVGSPSGQVSIEIALEQIRESEAVPNWRVSFKSHPVVRTSRLAMDLGDGQTIGGPCSIESVETIRRPRSHTSAPKCRSNARQASLTLIRKPHGRSKGTDCDHTFKRF